jgi:hypothetical protein
MWNLIHCYLSGRHDYGMWCEPGAMFLRCVHCGKRTSGWAVEARFHQTAPRLPVAPPVVTTPARILPFDRAAAS